MFTMALGVFEPLVAYLMPAAAIVLTMVSMVVTVIAIKSIRSVRIQRSRNFREEKAAAYQVLIGIWQEIIQEHRQTGRVTLSEYEEELLALDRLVVTYGNRRVIRTLGALRTMQWESAPDSEAACALLAHLVLEMREDLGSGRESISSSELESILTRSKPIDPQTQRAI